MENTQVLNLAVDKVKLLHEASDAQLAVAEIWVCRSGQNSHKLPIDITAIKQAEPTLINKFLVAGYDEKNKDFKGHEGLAQRIVGFFPKENKIRYVDDGDGETYLVANAIISKVYVPWAYDSFVSNNYREVSMEISVAETEVREDGYTWITSFFVNGVTILGLNRKASIAGSHAVITEFADLIEQGEQFYQEFSINSNSDLTDAEAKNKVEEEQTNMEFNKEEFAKVVGMTASQMESLMSMACREKKFSYEGETYECTKYYMRDYSNEYIFAYDNQADTLVALSYTFEDGKPKIDFENPKGCMETFVVDDSEPQVLGFSEVINEAIARKEELFSVEKETLTGELSKELKETQEKFSTIEGEKEVVVKELEDLKVTFEAVKTEVETLKEFKSNVEETEKKNKIEFAIQNVIEDLNAEQIAEWKGKVDTFESVDAFANAIQSFAYGLTKNKKGKNKAEFDRISIPNTSQEDNSKSDNVWSRLKK